MRYIVWIGLVYTLCIAQYAAEMPTDVCDKQPEGAKVDSGDVCTTCICNGGVLQCAAVACPEIKCVYGYEKKEGECCNSCKPGCDSVVGRITPGDSKTSEDGCTTCSCSVNSEIACLAHTCEPCQGLFTKDDTCCGNCDKTKCVENGVVYKNGDVFERNDTCESCRCSADGKTVKVSCEPVFCVQCVTEPIQDGSCCGKCKETPRCERDKTFYDIGEEIKTNDPCETCHCVADKEKATIVCATQDCFLKCVIQPGTCCECAGGPMCEHAGNTYYIGETIKTKDPCETCRCEADNGRAKVECSTMACLVCDPEKKPGTCCACEGPKCVLDGRTYDIGDIIPSNDRCRKCKCGYGQNGPEVQCSQSLCPQCIGKLVDDDSCCGDCSPGCHVGKEFYPVGIEVPGKRPCDVCICKMSVSGVPVVDCSPIACTLVCPYGQQVVKDDKTCCGHCEDSDIPTVDCSTVKCAAPNCKEKLQIKPKGQCCTLCKCKLKRKKFVNPGPFMKGCKKCMCENGKVNCISPQCHEKSLQCVDAELGEDCCYHCPHGKTCFHPAVKGKVIKNGETKTVRGMSCTCEGHPWSRSASCKVAKIPQWVGRRYREQMADYVDP